MIILYKTETCPYCNDAKDYLDKIDADYKEVNIGKDAKAAEEMVNKSGQMGVPVIDIDGQIIVGFDKEKIDKLLKK